MSARDESSNSPSAAVDADLDAILAIQLTVAWAGERISGENRLAWWRTELTDPEAGGDFLARLLLHTHAWAGLAAVREATRRRSRASTERNARRDVEPLPLRVRLG